MPGSDPHLLLAGPLSTGTNHALVAQPLHAYADAMPPNPPETSSKIRQHDNDIAEIYGKLTTIEQKADVFGTELNNRFDRFEARILAADVSLGDMETALTQVGSRLDRIDGDLSSMTGHLAGIDTHLADMDASFAEVLRRLPEPS